MSGTQQSGLTKVEPTAQQVKLWEETMTGLEWVCPSFTYIAYKLLNFDGSKHTTVFTSDVPVAATDGFSMFWNPVALTKLNLKRRVFITAHEIFHNILEHMVISWGCQRTGKVKFSDGTSLPYDHGIMGQTMDYIINDALITAKIGEFPSDGEYKGLHDPTLITGEDELFDAYRKLYKKLGGGGGGKGKEPDEKGDGHGGGFCQHLEPGTGTGKDPASVVAGHNPQHVQGTVQAGMQVAKLMGKLPANLERLLGKIVEGSVDWTKHIRALMARKVGSGGYDWRKPDRRWIVRDVFVPSRSGYGCELVVCASDSSGSIDQPDIDLFFGEFAGILQQVKPRRIIHMWCDAHVHSVDEISDPSELTRLHKKGAQGGGGTSFIPVFDKIAELGLKPDALVYLTDLAGAFPSHAPAYPVIWGNIAPGMKAPFGDVVDVPKQAVQ